MAGFGEILSGGLKNFGSGLGEGFQQLANQKLQQVLSRNQQSQTVKGLESLGISADEAKSLSALDPNILNTVVKNKLSAPGDQAFAQALSGLLGGNQQPGQDQMQMGENGAQQQIEPSRLNSKQAIELAKIGLKQQESQRRISHAKDQAIEKETLPYYKKIVAAKESATASKNRLSKMKSLVEKGGLPIASFYNLFKNLEEQKGHLGNIISPVGTLLRNAQKLTSPNTEQFEKLSSEFIKDAKSIFGSRITDTDLKAFMAQVPTLGNTDKGKLAIIKNLEIANEAEELKYKAAKQIIKENNGKRPANFEFLVEERVKSKLDKLAEKFLI